MRRVYRMSLVLMEQKGGARRGQRGRSGKKAGRENLNSEYRKAFQRCVYG